MGYAEAREACNKLLVELEEDIREYIIGMLEGDETEEEMKEAISEFLLSTGDCADEDAATAKVTELFASLSAATPDDPATLQTELKILDATVKMSAGDERLFREKDDSGLGGRLVDIDEALSTRKKRKAEREAELKATRNAYQRILVQRAAEEAALQKAVTDAVKLRRQLGAYTGAVEAKAFSLPNPGGGRDLLENASFTLVRGRIYALIGRNGKGKSTLLRALASRAVGDIPPELTVHYVSQEVQLEEERYSWTPVQFVVHADVERRLLLAEQAELQAAGDQADAARQQQIEEALEQCDAATAEDRATALLAALGFSPELRARPMAALSGGWRVRTALAAAIFAKPDLLLLDEPTNHLSIAAVLWLARELTTNEAWQQRIIVVVSHDRVFLDEIASDTLHVSGAARRLTQSRGNFSGWAQRRAQQQLTFEREMAQKQNQIKELRAFDIGKLGSTPKAMKTLKSKEKQADKLEEEARAMADDAAALQEDAETPLSLKAGGELGNQMCVQIKGVGFRYPTTAPPPPTSEGDSSAEAAAAVPAPTPVAADAPLLFRGAEMGIDSKSRIVLLGENGNGKTTLVKLMLGDLQPTEGEIIHAQGVRIALVNQHHADQLDLTMSPLQFLMDKFPGDGSYDHEQALRSHLHSCGVLSEMMLLPSSALSGGQRSRVALAAVSYTQPHVLVLDEPTNNLDLESVASLADCIESFAGGVVLVSHDQYFVSRVAKEVWVVDKGTVKKAESFDAYRKAQLAKLK